MINFHNVVKRFGTQTVIDHLNLSIGGGDFVSIIGPSGAGKTTLINLLLGSEKPDGGMITVDGYEIQAFSKYALQLYRRKLGVVFQEYLLLPKKTVYENVAFALEVCDVPAKEVTKKVDEVLAKVGLLTHRHKFPYQLSGGERQRTAIARALIHDPKLLLADEPTGNLDPITAQEIIDLFLRINLEGTTVILTTHNRSLVNRMQRRVIRLENGRIMADVPHGGYGDAPEASTSEMEITEIIL